MTANLEVTGRVWVFVSDGELQEGQTWEAFQVMRFYNLRNMAVIFDMNAQQCDGEIDSVMPLGPVADKLRAFGAHVVEVDGHDIEAIAQAAQVMPEQGPLAILARTHACEGMPYLEKRRPRLHYVRFTSAEEKRELEDAIRKQL